MLPGFRPTLNSLITWVVGSITPIALVVPLSVNQTLPSGPAAIPSGMLPAFRPTLNSLITCVAGSIIPTALVVPGSLNHMLPSGPIAIERTALPGFRPALNSVIVPPVVIRPTAPARSLNQRLPSEPATTCAGFAAGMRPPLNSVICPSGAAAAAPTPSRIVPNSSAQYTVGMRSLRRGWMNRESLTDPPRR